MINKFLSAIADTNQRAEMEAFQYLTGLERVASGRYSFLLLLSLFGGYKSGKVDPHKVVHEIKLLEKGAASDLKPPTELRYPPLQGLWHKHYLDQGVVSLAKNAKRGFKKYGSPFLYQKNAEAVRAGEVRYPTQEDISLLANDLISGNLQRLRNEGQMTGEWLLYATHMDKNYYLDTASHERKTHDYVRCRIDNICCHEFPFLEKQLCKLN